MDVRTVGLNAVHSTKNRFYVNCSVLFLSSINKIVIIGKGIGISGQSITL